MVDYSSLENYRTERYRGFESLSLRFKNMEPAEFQRVLFFSPLEVPFEVPFSLLLKFNEKMESMPKFDRSNAFISALM